MTTRITKRRTTLNKTSSNRKKLWLAFDNVQKDGPHEIVADHTVVIQHKTICDKCSTILAYSEEGFLVCPNKTCCIMYMDIVDHTAEWKIFNAEDGKADMARCGMPHNELLPESSWGCMMVCGKGFIKPERRKMMQYITWNSMPHHEKTQYDEFNIITHYSQEAGIPRIIIEDAKMYYHKITECNFSFRGNNRDGIIAASVYIACRKNGAPRSSREIADIFHLDYASANKGCKNALNILARLEHGLDNDEKTVLQTTTSETFIDRYCSQLHFQSELVKLCKFIYHKIEKHNIMPENAPQSKATGIILFVATHCNLTSITKQSIKDISKISEVTIIKCYKKIEQLSQQEEIIPSVIKHKYTTGDTIFNRALVKS